MPHGGTLSLRNSNVNLQLLCESLSLIASAENQKGIMINAV